MKPTTFLSIIGISVVFLVAFFKFDFRKNDSKSNNKVPLSKAGISVVADNKEDKPINSQIAVPKNKINERKKQVRIEKPKKISEKQEIKVEEIKKEEPKVLRDPDPRKDFANVFWSKQYTLFDLMSDEPIFPTIKDGEKIYKIYFSSNEDPNPYLGYFTEKELERHLFYKFKNLTSCQKFCDSKK